MNEEIKSKEEVKEITLEEKIEEILNGVGKLEMESLLIFSVGFHLGCYLSKNREYKDQFRNRLKTILNDRMSNETEENKIRYEKILELGELVLQQ